MAEPGLTMYGRLADRLDETALTAGLPGLQKALRDGGPRG